MTDDHSTKLRNAGTARGFDLELLKYPPRPGARWLMIASGVFLGIILIMILGGPLDGKPFTLFFLFGLGACCWLATTVQLRFERVLATTIVGVFGLLILLVASGFLTPQEAAERAREILQRAE